MQTCPVCTGIRRPLPCRICIGIGHTFTASAPGLGSRTDLKGPRESQLGVFLTAVRCSAEVDDPGVLSAADEVIVLRLQKEDLIGQVRSPCATM